MGIRHDRAQANLVVPVDGGNFAPPRDPRLVIKDSRT